MLTGSSQAFAISQTSMSAVTPATEACTRSPSCCTDACGGTAREVLRARPPSQKDSITLPEYAQTGTASDCKAPISIR